MLCALDWEMANYFVLERQYGDCDVTCKLSLLNVIFCYGIYQRYTLITLSVRFEFIGNDSYRNLQIRDRRLKQFSIEVWVVNLRIGCKHRFLCTSNG